jgi:hypothetical protein
MVPALPGDSVNCCEIIMLRDSQVAAGLFVAGF